MSTQKPIGINTIKKFGGKIASLLNLNNPHTYTGHWVRRTAITMGVESGLTLHQLKCLSGHKSDGVLQEYIENGEPMKRVIAESLHLSKRSTPTTDNEKNKAPRTLNASTTASHSTPIVSSGSSITTEATTIPDTSAMNTEVSSISSTTNATLAQTSGMVTFNIHLHHPGK